MLNYYINKKNTITLMRFLLSVLVSQQNRLDYFIIDVLIFLSFLYEFLNTDNSKKNLIKSRVSFN